MKHLPWTRYLLAASLALNLGIVLALVLRPTPPPSAALATPEHPLNVQDYLELSAAQRTRWQQLEPAFLHALTANWQAIRQHREALVRQIFAPTPQRTAIDAEQAALAALQAAQQQHVIEQLLAERDILTPEQRQRLMALLLSRYAQEATKEELLHRD